MGRPKYRIANGLVEHRGGRPLSKSNEGARESENMEFFCASQGILKVTKSNDSTKLMK